MYTGKYYFETDNFKLIYADVFRAIKKINDKSIDMIFADPPYFLSSDGITCSGGKMVSVNKGEWDKTLSIKEKHKFNKKWIKECNRVLKDNGTIWISGTLHNIYSIGMALEEEGFKIINNITWQKTNPPPNLACKTFTHSTETIIWARKNLKNVKLIEDADRQNKSRIILATSTSIGEGFDDSRLDTLFLTMPVSWKGRIIQYVGRLHREHIEKTKVIVYDYLDNMKVLDKMYNRRLKGYKVAGYEIIEGD